MKRKTKQLAYLVMEGAGRVARASEIATLASDELNRTMADLKHDQRIDLSSMHLGVIDRARLTATRTLRTAEDNVVSAAQLLLQEIQYELDNLQKERTNEHA